MISTSCAIALLLISIKLLVVQTAATTLCGNLSIVDVMATSSAAEWTGPDDESYTIQLTELETEAVWFFFAIQPVKANFIGLHPYYNYELNVTIVKALDEILCDLQTFRTQQAAPTGSPLMFNHSETSTTVNISWFPPLEELQNGLITHYVVILKEDQRSSVLKEFTVNETWIFIEELLQPFTNYKVSVAAFTVGEGPSVDYGFLTAEDAPSSPPSDVSLLASSNSSLTIAWSPPPINHRNGIVRSYFIRVVEQDNPYRMFNVTTNSSSTNVTINDLLPYRMYDISIGAKTVSLGVFSGAVTLTTNESAPSGPPLNVSITNIQSTFITLSWSPPDPNHRNGIIIEYTVEVNSAIDRGSIVRHTRTSATISGLRPYLNYTIAVSAATSIGLGPYSNLSLLETLQDAPIAPPQNISFPSVTSNGFGLTWEPPLLNYTNGIITRYIIQIYEVENMKTYRFNSSANALYMTFNQFHPSYEYRINMSAYTIAMGIFSEDISVVLNEDVPAGPPQSFQVIKLSSTTVTLTWDAPLFSDRNGVITGYKIFLMPTETNAEYNYSSGVTKQTFTGLIPNTSYSAQIAAGTKIGYGNYSNILTFSTHEDAPTQPPSVRTYETLDPSTVILEWDPPPPDSHNGVIRHYLINVSDELEHVMVTKEEKNFAVIVSLTPAVTYTFKVAAVTVGRGPYSEEVMLTMPEDSPDAEPQNVMAQFTNDGNIFLTWDAPVSHYGTITEYLIRLVDLSVPKIYQYNTGTGRTQLTIPGHQLNTSYAISIAAVNVRGTGPFSHAIYIIYNDTIPQSTEFRLKEGGGLELYEVIVLAVLCVCICVIIILVVITVVVLGYRRFKQRKRVVWPPPETESEKSNNRRMKRENENEETNTETNDNSPPPIPLSVEAVTLSAVED